MNDDQELTRTELEQATARQLSPEVPLEPETAALRDGWLALGSLLDGAGQRLDQAALAARLQAELIDPPRPVQPARHATGSSWWPAIVGTALALTMLVAVIRSLPRGAVTKPGGTSGLATNEPDQWPEPAAWSDPLDDQIGQAAEQVQALVAQSQGIDDSLTGISHELESMSDELQHGSL
jgi:hypothetical protein